jgi:hypothetical protein
MKAARQPTPTWDLIEPVFYELRREIRFACGLVLAVRGLGMDADGNDPDDYRGAAELASAHVEGLEKIAAALEAFNANQMWPERSTFSGHAAAVLSSR